MKKDKKTIKAKVSPFKPKFIKNLVPSGLKFFSFHVGFKKKNNDLLILIFENDLRYLLLAEPKNLFTIFSIFMVKADNTCLGFVL